MFAVTGITLGLVVGLWLALLLGGLNATEEAPVDTSSLEGDLDGLQRDLAALNGTLAESHGRLADTADAINATNGLADALQDQLGRMANELDGLLVAMAIQEDRYEALSAELDATQDDLDLALAQLQEAQRQLSYAQGRMDQLNLTPAYQNGTQVYVNMSLDELADVMAQLADVIDQLAQTQLELKAAIDALIAAQGGGPPAGIALPSPHLTHYKSELIIFSCRMCHNVNVPGNLTEYDGKLYFEGNLTGTGFVTTIDKNAVCSKCHDVFPAKMDPSLKTRDCTVKDCHDDWRQDMSSPYVNEAFVTKDDCLLCHGGQPFYPR